MTIFLLYIEITINKGEIKMVKEEMVPFGNYQTYCRIVGEETDRAPLVFLHGGPGSSHNYFELLDDLARQSHRKLIMYDQIGCGQSSIPDDHPELYNAQTWVAELQNLRQYLHLGQIHLLGQSWGGMLAIIYLCDYHPQGVQSLILSSTLSSAKLWASELHRLIQFMPLKDQQAIQLAEAENDFTSDAYQKANAAFMELHAAAQPTDSSPEPLRRPKRGGEQAYLTAWGPNEYNPQGNLANYEYTDQLKDIQTPSLIIDGTNDLCTPLVAKTMADQLPHSSWHLFQNARHMVFVEQPRAYQHLLTQWLLDHDK